MKKFEVWMTGYSCTGDHGTARLLGKINAENFNEAVEKCISQKDMKSDYRKDYDEYGDLRHSYWGCRIYDNEQQAREKFG